MMDTLSQIGWDPLLPWPIIAGLLILAAIAALIAGPSRLRSGYQRLLAALFLGLALANPQLIDEDRTPLNDTLILLQDRSASMEIGSREVAVQRLASTLREQAGQLERPVDVVSVEINDDADGTQLSAALIDALGSVPADRLAGVIALTDGRVHDVSAATADVLPDDIPFHALIVGDQNARDRRVQAITAPKFGVVGELAEFTLRVDDPGHEGERAQIELRLNGERKARFPATIGTPIDIPLEIEQRGRNVIELTVEPVESGELTLNNNIFVSEISGIRDRMRVLLITGEPHRGGRSWRNLLKSDPAIDLVQFTILTQPRVKNVNAQERELSLIRFPTRQLFEERLDDFDLIIFDQYRRRSLRGRRGRTQPTILPQYFDNISRYVEGGGALLLATGPAFASEDSLFLTPLASVLPTRPTGELVTDGFRAELNREGRLHPITRSFAGSEDQSWGPWYRAIGNDPISGNVLMEGPDGTPLMLIDRVGDGRVAMLMSDQAWLWAKGHKGGGPYREIFRRTAHWLMGEPDLSAETLEGRIEDGTLTVERRTLGRPPENALVIFPDGRDVRVPMSETSEGRYTGRVPASEVGAYRLRHGDISTVAAIGRLNPVEYAQLLPTLEPLQPLSEATEGRVLAIVEGDTPPNLRQTRSGPFDNRNALEIKDNRAYTVTRSRRSPLAPPIVFFLFFFAALAWGWLREAR